ncbi:MAG TPA: YiiX/YebB-like N1pC/P60 family cysteine hydrolase [Myxococcota bacterium]|nr:YiiX/YebB-like N1pC/P60 family cysteine hydrolase [Myxococcota bacterium]
MFIALISLVHSAEPALADGDLVFQRSRSDQAAAIALATGSPWTHMGVVFLVDGEPMVLEAVQPVKWTPYSAWVARGVDGEVHVKRLKEPPDAEQIAAMRTLGESWVGLDYDLAFGWSDDRMYCSELAWKLYDRGADEQVGELARFGDHALEHPEVRRKLEQRYGKDLPLAETVISPGAMYDDPDLTLVLPSAE